MRRTLVLLDVTAIPGLRLARTAAIGIKLIRSLPIGDNALGLVTVLAREIISN
jgi:hypothetical protein